MSVMQLAECVAENEDRLQAANHARHAERDVRFAPVLQMEGEVRLLR
jgi:hypothetical protein